MIEMNKITPLICAVLAIAFPATVKSSWETVQIDFTDVRDCSVVAKGKFSGVLTKGWQPNYQGWTSCEASGRVINEAMEHFFRIDVEKIDSQWVQFVREIPQPVTGKFYKLTIQYRNLQDNNALLQIRRLHPPYSTLWRTSLGVTAEWKKDEYIFSPQKNVPPGEVGLFLCLNATGYFDIVSLKLSEASADEMNAATQSIRRPEKKTKNFLRNSTLPLGLQSGWNFSREQTPQWKLSAEAGPSGQPYLILKDTTLLTEPFQVAVPETAHTFSFSYRGEGRVLIRGKWQILPLKKEWTRAAFRFIPEKDRKGYQFQIQAGSILALDAFRVTVGHEEDYVPPAECEVALACPESETSASRLQFLDEPARVRYRIAGFKKGNSLQIRIVNLYGEQVEFSLVPECADGEIDFHKFCNRATGQFRVEAYVVKNGKRISPINEMVITRLERPVYWKQDAPGSPFGIHVLANDPVLKSLKAAGVNHVRLHDAGTAYIGWAFLEPRRGEWHFRDEALQRYRRNNLKILGGLSTAPAWANGVDKMVKNPEKLFWLERYRLRYAAPRNLKDFAQYVSTVVKRYRQVIDEYMVWNEPWSNFFFYQGVDQNGKPVVFDDSASAYFALQKCAFETARFVAPEVRIAGYCSIAGGIGERWNRALTRLGANEFCDIVDFHLYSDRYTGYPGDIAECAVQELAKTIPVKKNQRIYMSEGQGASKSAWNEAVGEYVGMYFHSIPWANRDNNLELSELQCRYIVSLLAAGVDRIYLYSAHTYEGLTKQPNFLALLQADGYPSPQLVAHAALARLLEDKKYVCRKDFKNQVYVYCFSAQGESTAVVIPRKTAASYLLQSKLPGVRRVDLYGNPYDDQPELKRVLYFFHGRYAPEQLLSSLDFVSQNEVNPAGRK